MYYHSGRSGRSCDIEIDSSFRKWILGIVVRLPVIFYAVYCIVTQHAVFGGHRTSRGIDLIGAEAIWYGITVLGFALFGHFHCFWGECEGREGVAVIGKILSFLTICVAGITTIAVSI